MQGPLTWILRLREDAARNTKRSPQKDPRRIIKGLLGEGFDFTWTFTRSSHQDLSKSVQKHYREAELAGSPQDLFRRICARSRKDFFMDFSTIITRSSQKDLCKIQQGPRRGCQHDLHNALWEIIKTNRREDAYSISSGSLRASLCNRNAIWFRRGKCGSPGPRQPFCATLCNRHALMLMLLDVNCMSLTHSIPQWFYCRKWRIWYRQNYGHEKKVRTE